MLLPGFCCKASSLAVSVRIRLSSSCLSNAKVEPAKHVSIKPRIIGFMWLNIAYPQSGCKMPGAAFPVRLLVERGLQHENSSRKLRTFDTKTHENAQKTQSHRPSLSLFLPLDRHRCHCQTVLPQSWLPNG